MIYNLSLATRIVEHDFIYFEQVTLLANSYVYTTISGRVITSPV